MIKILGNLKGNAVVKSGATYSFGIALDQQVNATITITSLNGYFTVNGPLAFTTSNYATPQTVTITAVEDSVLEGIKYDTIIFTGHGTVRKTIAVIDSGMVTANPFLLNWAQEIKVTNEADIATLRASLISEITDGAGFSSLEISPTIVSSAWSGNMHVCSSANLTGYNNIVKATFSILDRLGYTWTNTVYFIFREATPSTKLAFVMQGHISDDATKIEAMINDALADGYDVAFCTLPISSNDNTETNPNITSQSTGGHDQIVSTGLHTAGWNSLKLHMFDKVSALTYLLANYSYTKVCICGNSGGGWTCALWAAIDDRIHVSVPSRGTIPRIFRDATTYPSAGNLNEGDSEQGGGANGVQVRCGSDIYSLYTSYPYMTLYLMGTDNGRRVRINTCPKDSCCFVGYTYSLWKQYVTTLSSSWGGYFDHTYNEVVGEEYHSFQPKDRENILSAFDA